ncbi:TetR/AcrR family transcriptional regulator [Rhodococcus sp. APC 3903]|uniref:TetR/AcrR family transcriptional regulator n=1 Tax=Rhodococcus sp. APC 3903 TaxID=3035193 RepID=UPI0025B5FD73|nr:TetR/AcrR family transcriptional regulator [Rhodococcus sp. APC 3903]MDN3460706.1 TetR/AcrR family transcriptional regulator [Rhodococcus sp. APC 3903]
MAKSSEVGTLSLRERNKIRTRQELLQSALEVFADVGYGGATMEAIAALAGASKVTVYTYFPAGREELFRELYEQINTELLERAALVYADSGDYADHALALARALFDVAERPLYGRFYSIDDPALDQAVNPVRGHASSVWIDLISDDLARAAARGEVCTENPRALATLIVGAMRWALTDIARGRTTAQDLLAGLDALVRGLARRPMSP